MDIQQVQPQQSEPQQAEPQQAEPPEKMEMPRDVTVPNLDAWPAAFSVRCSDRPSNCNIAWIPQVVSSRIPPENDQGTFLPRSLRCHLSSHSGFV